MSEIWRRGRLSCPGRHQLGSFLLGALPDGEIEVRENGVRFGVDLARGQKGGLFLDQRDNRALVRTLAPGKRVLNLFGYTGGFSLYAALVFPCQAGVSLYQASHMIERGVDSTSAALIVSTFSLMSATASLGVGWLPRLWPIRRALAVCGALMCAGALVLLGAASAATGFLGAALHVNDAQTRIASYSQWRQREDFLAMLRSAEMRERNRRISALCKSFEPVMYEVAETY